MKSAKELTEELIDYAERCVVLNSQAKGELEDIIRTTEEEMMKMAADTDSMEELLESCRVRAQLAIVITERDAMEIFQAVHAEALQQLVGVMRDAQRD